MLTNLQREYNINRMFLSSVGLWPYQNKITRYLLGTFCFLLEISFYHFEILLLYDHWNDADMFFEGCYQFITSSCFIARLLNEYFNHDKFRKLYETIDEHWNIFTITDLENEILKSYLLVSRKFIIYYSILMYTVALAFMVRPLTPIFLDVMSPLNETRPRLLPLKVSEFRGNKNEDYIPMFCYTTLIIIVGMTIFIAVDAMHISCTAHACSLFASVGQQIKNIKLRPHNCETRERGYDMDAEIDSLCEEATYREYIMCLKKHQSAIEFVNILDSTYQGLPLFLLLSIIVFLSSIATQVVLTLNQPQDVIQLLFAICSCMMILIIVCYPSQRLLDESQSVFHLAYEAEWYNYSPRLKSLLIILLYRSNVPCGLKAGKMIPLSTVTMASVIRTTVSYFTTFLSLTE